MTAPIAALLVLIATGGEPAKPIPLWYGGIDCYVPTPAIGAMQRKTRNFDAYSAEGGAANDLACFRLNETLMHLRRGQ